ncbi:hypothetical protein FRC08_004823 [Ceratobasidium sp. 394]|nr:hypothetical protein FRC08_004823 [Ceratobasidium sp. 394]
MAALYATLCIIQTLLGIGPRKDESRNTTDWLKLALAVAAQPEDEESKRLVHVALESNNQEFLGLLRAALDTRVAAAARLADIESDGIECRAFLPGSPALWGWTTNTVAESTILKAGIESAMSASVFDSPPTLCKTGEDVFIGPNSSETMGGATLRDIYAKAWEFHREPLIWTPRGPGAGLGASTWTLTPASLTSQGARNRNRSISDASESRSSIAGQSPCLHAQRNRNRRESLHDVFTAIDTKKDSKASPCAEAGIITPAQSSVTPPSASALSEPPVSRRPRRSTSCTRSHVSSTTAVTVSECSTTQELQGLGLGRSLDRSVWLRPGTPSGSWFGGCGEEITSNGERVALPQTPGGHGLVSAAAAFRRNKAPNLSNFKQSKAYRPGITPLQQSKNSVPKRMSELQPLGSPAARSQEPCSLRRARSVAAMTPSPSPYSSRVAGRKTPLIGPVPAARRVSTKLAPAELQPSQDLSQESTRGQQSLHPHPASTPTALRQSGITRRIPTMSQSRIPRPVSRADSISGSARTRSPSVSSASRTPRREPQQLLTPISTVRVRERVSSQAARPAPASSMGRARSRTGSSTQERPNFAKDIRLSRPPSRAHLTTESSDVVRRRSRRSNSITSVSELVDRWGQR